MADDYFQDVLQQSGTPARPQPPKKTADAGAGAGIGQNPPPPGSAERSIRNITVSPRRRERGAGDMREISPGPATSISGRPPQEAGRKIWIWAAAVVSVLVLIVLALFIFRSTTVTVIPRSHAVVFDQTSNFVAYPVSDAAIGTLSYSVAVNDLEDSAVVKSEGKEHAEERAEGTIEVFNEYGSASVRLIKNTRFATEGGLVFRVPATVVIPGMKGAKAGSVTVTVFADQAGQEYNVGPVARFTLPGLKTSPDMYAKVYARSYAPMTGGFVGDRPSVLPSTLESARAEIRGRLETKARDTIRSLAGAASIVFPELAKLTYESLPMTTEAGGDVRLHEKAHIETPVFPASELALAVANAAGANVENAGVSLTGIDQAKAALNGAAPALGKDPLEFTLSGGALIVWSVDASALASALAGRDNSAFQAIVNDFPGIQEARARIEPFWKGTFPASPDDIKIELEPAQTVQ